MGHFTCKTVPTTGIIGAIAGDCFGAAYEFHPVKHGDFDIYKEPRFTDDTVMTLAVATKGMEMPEELARCAYKCLMIIFVRYLMSLTGAIKRRILPALLPAGFTFKNRT